MNKKLFISLTLALITIFSFTICFATDGSGLGNAANNVRNFVGGIENTVENAALDISNASKDATGDMENSIDNNDSITGMTSNNNSNSRYSVARTSTQDNTIMGMTSTGWTWLIIGIAAIAIIAVVWYYSMQFTNSNYHNDNND